MTISSRYSVAIHILVLIKINKEETSSSEFLAGSVNTNPTLIRKIMGMLKKAGLIEVRPGVAGAKLAKDPSDITLLEVYKAVNVVQENELFSVHENPNPDCLVGRNIQDVINPVFTEAQQALETALFNKTLENVIKEVCHKEEHSM